MIKTRRRGFTLNELLIASLCTVTIVAAGTTMALAVSYSAAATQSDNTAVLQAQSAVRRIAKAVRAARMIGYYTTGSAVLWRDDANNDDTIQLSETELYWFDSATHSVKRTRPYRQSMTAGQIALTDRAVSLAELTGSGIPTTIQNAPNAETVVMALNAVDVDLKCNTTGGTTNLIDMRISVRANQALKRMAMSAAPRAPADYLTDSSKNTNDGVPTKRLRRTAPRTWTVPTAAVQAW